MSFNIIVFINSRHFSQVNLLDFEFIVVSLHAITTNEQ